MRLGEMTWRIDSFEGFVYVYSSNEATNCVLNKAL